MPVSMVVASPNPRESKHSIAGTSENGHTIRSAAALLSDDAALHRDA